MLLLLGVVGLGLGLSIGHPVGTVAFLLLVAATFLAVQQMLLSVLGSAAGKVAAIALLMLQITSASGTYPVETTPAFFQAIHHVLPMTYAVGGLRSLITGHARRAAVDRRRLPGGCRAGVAGGDRVEGRTPADLDRGAPAPGAEHLRG